MTLTRTFAPGQTGHLADMAAITKALDCYDAINAQTGTTYTIVIADLSKLITVSNASAGTLLIPTNAVMTVAVGTRFDLGQLGAGQFTIQAVTPGTTSIVSTGATTTAPMFRAQNSGATAIKIATDSWWVTGDIV